MHAGTPPREDAAAWTRTPQAKSVGWWTEPPCSTPLPIVRAGAEQPRRQQRRAPKSPGRPDCPRLCPPYTLLATTATARTGPHLPGCLWPVHTSPLLSWTCRSDGVCEREMARAGAVRPLCCALGQAGPGHPREGDRVRAVRWPPPLPLINFDHVHSPAPPSQSRPKAPFTAGPSLPPLVAALPHDSSTHLCSPIEPRQEAAAAQHAGVPPVSGSSGQHGPRGGSRGSREEAAAMGQFASRQFDGDPYIDLMRALPERELIWWVQKVIWVSGRCDAWRRGVCGAIRWRLGLRW